MIATDGLDTIANKTPEVDALMERITAGLTVRIIYDRKNGKVQLYTAANGWEEYTLIVPDNVRDAYDHPMTYVERPDKYFEKT